MWKKVFVLCLALALAPPAFGASSDFTYKWSGIKYGISNATVRLDYASLPNTTSPVAPHAAVWLGANDKHFWIQGGILFMPCDPLPWRYVEIGNLNTHTDLHLWLLPGDFYSSTHIRLINQNGTWSVKIDGKRYGIIKLSHAIRSAAIEIYGPGIAQGKINQQTVFVSH